MNLIHSNELLQGLLSSKYLYSNEETANVFCNVKIDNGDEVIIYGRIKEVLKNQSKIVIVDGNNLYAVCYFSVKGNTSKIQDAFIGILRGMFEREHDSTHLFVCWDDNDSKKKKEDESYKAGRSPKPDNYYDAFYPLQNYLQDNQVQQYVVNDIEADDIIGKIVGAAKGHKCVIVSNDKDMYQLITKDDNVYIFNTVKQTWVDYKKFYEQYGVEPHQFKYILALMGKVSNNITGIKGIGEKTAIKAIQKYGDFATLFASDFSGISKKFAEKFKSGKEDAYYALKQVEFLTDFKLPKATCSKLPDLFKM